MGGQSSPSFGGIETGGAADIYHADVWRSEDGASWTLVADRCPWGPRGMISGSAVLTGLVIFNKRLQPLARNSSVNVND